MLYKRQDFQKSTKFICGNQTLGAGGLMREIIGRGFNPSQVTLALSQMNETGGLHLSRFGGLLCFAKLSMFLAI